MKIGAKLNIWSMLLMLFCWAAIFIPIPSIPFNRHYVILTTSIIVFFLSVMGLGLMIADQVAMELKVENMLAPDGDEVKGETL
ncbi:hypothetical protein QPK24_11940 [Paenibacillus polygoni]|uniref:Uncharacterized protein n=1 Tax=Paenibacillus polygoni TaxID=3050112 RepID=A0ABY8XA19_9BACL|nr:hypothetical protein [Paenibacillus polygoni]WIV21331.1 hypothetical protein QPK24_11940 [Paenibacillus polygoni]